MKNEIKGEKRDQRAAIIFRHSIDQRERLRYVKGLARPKKGEERMLALQGPLKVRKYNINCCNSQVNNNYLNMRKPY
jgi:hypothetical protein